MLRIIVNKYEVYLRKMIFNWYYSIAQISLLT